MVVSLTTACGSKPATNTNTTTPAATTKTETTSAPTATTKTESTSKAEDSKSDPAGNDTTGDFTLLDVSTEMIEAGVYAISEDGTELVFSMFTEPSGTPMASLFVFPANGEGDVICGTYTAESETDEDGITWTLLTVSDVYTGEEFDIGFGELGDQIYILDSETAYEGKYLTADETIIYMGTAAALLEE